MLLYCTPASPNRALCCSSQECMACPIHLYMGVPSPQQWTLPHKQRLKVRDYEYYALQHACLHLACVALSAHYPAFVLFDHMMLLHECQSNHSGRISFMHSLVPTEQVTSCAMCDCMHACLPDPHRKAGRVCHAVILLSASCPVHYKHLPCHAPAPAPRLVFLHICLRCPCHMSTLC